MVQLSKKRSGRSSSQPPKRRKVDGPADTTNRRVRSVPKKEKAAHRKTIPIPSGNSDAGSNSGLDEDDAVFFRNETSTSSLTFLSRLDQKAITRSKHETDRLHKLSKPARAPRAQDDDLPSIHSHSEDEGLWDSGVEGYLTPLESEGDGDGRDDDRASNASVPSDSSEALEVEDVYERKARKPPLKEEQRGAERLPVKLQDGKIKKRGFLPVTEQSGESDDSATEEATTATSHLDTAPSREDISTGARFGRPAVTAVIGNKSRKARIQGAKEQLATICQDVIADPENNLGLLRRLHTFSLPSISTPTNPKSVQNDPIVRKLAFLSQLAVFKDIVPGYRIRPLTDKEKEEKVSQMVQRVRDYEQGLVTVYQYYLQILEQDIKAKSDLAETALQCLCSLLEELPHFNFRINLMSSIVAQLSKRSWSEASEMCLQTLCSVLDKDQTGEASLELVRLLNRMIKERRFNVHPNVLTCLLHLRLKTELGVKASDTRADRDEKLLKMEKRRKGKNKYNTKPVHLSKAAKKAEKERKEIEQEVREAEAEVDREEREKTHTETLKLLFVLYFRVLKAPERTPLLPAALLGISKFAHLVNVDFFKDLLATLRTLIVREDTDSETAKNEGDDGAPLTGEAVSIRHRLMCIVTAFELLSGQGEALNIDLVDFVNFLYGIILELALTTSIEDSEKIEARQGGHPSIASDKGSTLKRHIGESSMADLLFRALSLVFVTRSSAQESPSWRSAAFAKRLLTAALSWPPRTACRAINFTRALLSRDPTLEALLSAEEKVASGIYRPDISDPQLSGALHAANFWELRALAKGHWDAGVREEARRLIQFNR